MELPLTEFAANSACCCDGNAHSKQLLLNGGFEAFQIHPYLVPQPAPPETRYYFDLITAKVPGWSVSSGDAGYLIQNNGPLQYQNLDLTNCFNSPVGNQFVQLRPGGSLSQTITLETGKAYTFSFLQSGYSSGADADFAKAGASVEVTLSTPGYSVNLPTPYSIDPEAVANVSPIWRRAAATNFHVKKTGSYELTFTCPSKAAYENVPVAAFIDAVCLTELVAP
jgi:hypothetical protein